MTDQPTRSAIARKCASVAEPGTALRSMDGSRRCTLGFRRSYASSHMRSFSASISHGMMGTERAAVAESCSGCSRRGCEAERRMAVLVGAQLFQVSLVCARSVQVWTSFEKHGGMRHGAGAQPVPATATFGLYMSMNTDTMLLWEKEGGHAHDRGGRHRTRLR